MKTVTAYECSFCDLLSTNKLEVESHEMGCMLSHLYLKNKEKEQSLAREYLDSFRKKSRTLTELFTFIEAEQKQIIEAIKVVKFYRKNVDIAHITEFTYKNYGFSSPDKPDHKRMTHSSPVGKKQVPMHPYPEDAEEPLAFEIEVFYDIQRDRNKKQENVHILEFIGGINNGSGGSWHNGYHSYCTFWLEDFPFGLVDL